MAPVGEDMAHVRIAWGTPLLLLFLLLVCLPVLADVRRSRRKEKKYLDLSGLGICDERDS